MLTEEQMQDASWGFKSDILRGDFLIGARKANEAAAQEISELVDALREAALQIEYLQNKFQETGTENAVLEQVKKVLTKHN